MYYVSKEEQATAKMYLEQAARVAQVSTCNRSKCGSVIVKDGKVIGEGFNSPPCELASQRRCAHKKEEYDTKVTDKTCCIHAEQRAIIEALKKHPREIVGSRLYFARLDEEDNRKLSGDPYCTICSKMALESGVAEFVLEHDSGICVYDTEEYNNLSFAFTSI